MYIVSKAVFRCFREKMGRKYLKNEIKDLGEFVVFKNGLCEFKCKICKRSLNINLNLFVNHVKEHYTENFTDLISELKESSGSRRTLSINKFAKCKTGPKSNVISSIRSTNNKDESISKLEISLKSARIDKTINSHEACNAFETEILNNSTNNQINPENEIQKCDTYQKIISKSCESNACSSYNKKMYLSDYNGKFVENMKLSVNCDIPCKKNTEKSIEITKINPYRIQNFLNTSNTDLKDNSSMTDIQEMQKSMEDMLHVDSTKFSKPIMHHNDKLNNNEQRNSKCKNEAVDNTLKCERCSVVYKKHSTLARHQKICQGKLKINLKKTPSKLKEKNENGMYQCSSCELEFAMLNEIKSHEKVHSINRIKNKTQCEICGKYLNTGAGLNLHLMRHNGRSPFKCLVCNRGFYNKYTLASHQQIHNPEKEHKCEHCDKEYSRYVDLKRHIRYSHLKEKPNSVMCDLCGKSFSFAFNLKYHMRRHLNLKPVKCDKCNMTFVERGDLNKHLITHNPDHKPFVCEICSKSFSRKITLTKHQKLHTGLKEYVCKICGKAFAQSPGLYMHMKTHGFNIKPEGAGYYERQSHLLFRNMNSDRANFS